MEILIEFNAILIFINGIGNRILILGKRRDCVLEIRAFPFSFEIEMRKETFSNPMAGMVVISIPTLESHLP